ncbi:MAG: xanthine permease [Betaproteobacteria bacterium]|nr:MAG: xanthine permease [Betaproteobacteria bacterium]
MATPVYGYLPNDRPRTGRLILFGVQHVVTMFPATVLVALLCGFHVSTVLLGAGVSTIVALLLSRRRIGVFIPLFYGSSFSYIAAYLGVAQAMGHPIKFGVAAPDEVISVFQVGIVATGILNILAGLLIRAMGKETLDRYMPPVVSGSVACVIGIALAKAALDMSFTNGQWGIAFATLIATVSFSYLLQGRGLIGMLPILLGAAVGYVMTLVVAPGEISFRDLGAAPFVALPHLTWPAFTGPILVTAAFSIGIMAIATIPESTAHLYQISLYADRLAEEQGREKPHLERHVGFNLICDGLSDVIHGLFGATAGTNYGENNSLMAITRNYSGAALVAAGALCILLAFVGKLSAFLATIPVFVTGGLALYLFGVVGMQGIALMQERKVNLFDPLQLAVGATIMVIGVGGNIGFEGGFLPIKIAGVFPNGLPAIATAAVVGMSMYLVLSALRPQRDSAATSTEAARGEP